MTTLKSGQSPGPPVLDPDRETRMASAAHRASGAITIAGASASKLMRHVPGAVHATQAGTISALRSLPDSTLRWLMASSVGVGAGFYLAGAPRVVVAAGVAPALFMGAVIVGRPIEPVVPRKVR